MYNEFHSLSNNLLIAMPNLEDNYFRESVILLCEHNENGAMGLMVNRPLDITVAEILQQMKIRNNNPDLNKTPLLAGGPLKTEKGFILHYSDALIEDDEQEWDSSLAINEHLHVTTSDDIIHALARQIDPDPFLITLGYCEWQAGQLEKEIKNNDWLLAPLDLDILFNVPYLHKWRECTHLIGIDEISNLTTYPGHA